MRDFTIKSFKSLLLAFSNAGYIFLTFEAYCTEKQNHRDTEFCKQGEQSQACLNYADERSKIMSEANKFLILRHDIDANPSAALKIAQIEANLGIKATYYFRTIPATFNPTIIREIASLGHEVGYHYENLTTHNGNKTEAIKDFAHNLAKLREIAPIATASMHGVALSRYNNLDIWNHTSLAAHNLIGEPYLSTDFSRLFYITDTGRRWDGHRVSLRDKIPTHQDRWTAQGLTYRTTADIIHAIRNNTFPHQLMMTTHPQRWTSNTLHWTKQLISQRLKNIIKRLIILSK